MKPYFIFILLFLISCNDGRKDELEKSPSLYIQQHANDPVNWHVWSDDIFKKAKKENKLVLLSIGYSACHWCHVMQNESFKNEDIAKIMNTHYYCVKIDKEQYPDVNAYYAKMQEELTGWAGWPMHFILNYKKDIIWTGIYFKPDKWKNLISKVAEGYKRNSDIRFIKSNELVKNKYTNNTLNFDSINNYLIQKLDTINGGLIPERYSRKYPISSLFNYLLKVYKKDNNNVLEKFLKLTANKMMVGGLNDQIEGGFFRFSMDEIWHIPHFEKMLYTNTNLIKFYVNMYNEFKDEEYLQTAEKTAMFIFNNLKSKDTLYFGSMDAVQNDEGTYYLFTEDEFDTIEKSNLQYAKSYYNISNSWKLKNGMFHLYCSYSDSSYANIQHIPLKYWFTKKKEINKELLFIRQKKQKPKIDNKLITSWNSLFLESLTELYTASKKQIYLKEAQNIANFLISKFEKEKILQHFYLENEQINSNTYAEDLLYTIKALCKLYEIDKSKKEYINNAVLIYSEYLKNKDKLLLFPFDDRTMPSIITNEMFIVRFLNNETHTSYKAVKIDFFKVQEQPEYYGNVLSEY